MSSSPSISSSISPSSSSYDCDSMAILPPSPSPPPFKQLPKDVTTSVLWTKIKSIRNALESLRSYPDVCSSPSKLLDDYHVEGDPDILIVAENWQVACKDYPHPRHLCVTYPFEKTQHDVHCKMCYCYICDVPAPCKEWLIGSYFRHCDATADFSICGLLRSRKKSPLQHGTQNVTTSVSVEEDQEHDMKSVLSLKHEKSIREFDELDDCFICNFDPFVCSSPSELLDDHHVEDDPDILAVAEDCLVACKDYPHLRHLCARYPFEKTDHDVHCKMCYCYICDVPAPCKEWLIGAYFRHCDATASFPICGLLRSRKKSRLQHGTQVMAS